MKKTDKLSQLEGKLKNKKVGKQTRTKRSPKINYPWIKKKYSRKAKAYMAFIVDGSDFNNVDGVVKKKKKFFIDNIYPLVVKRFPKLYKRVKAYYNDKGHKLPKHKFVDLLYARLVNMYEDGFTVKTGEHPINAKNEELREAYLTF